MELPRRRRVKLSLRRRPTERQGDVMNRPRLLWILGGTSVLVSAGLLIGQSSDSQLTVEHPDCSYFGSQRERYVTDALSAAGVRSRSSHALTAPTEQVTAMRAVLPGGSRTYTYDQAHAAGSIDSYIWDDFKANAITPASRTTDWEFIRD